MNIVKLARNISTLGPIGYTVASGTLATLIAAPCALIVRERTSLLIYLSMTACLAIGGFWSICLSLDSFESDDPSCIVIDEVIGCFVALSFISYALMSIILAICLFRFFDITKTCGISYVEKIKGAAGIVLDDIAAGVATLIIIYSGSFFISFFYD